MLDLVGVGRDRRGIPRRGGRVAEDLELEACLDRTVVGAEVIQPQAVAGAVAGDDMDRLRDETLAGGQEIGVDADLQHRTALDGTGELGVGHLVAP